MPRTPSDEPAIDLLARLDLERNNVRLTRRKRTSDAPLAERVDLPSHWLEVRLHRLSASIDYGSSERATLDGSGVPILRMGNIVGRKISMSDLKYLRQEQTDPNLVLAPGDLLFNRTNSAELVGKNAIFHGSERPMTFASYLIRVRPLPSSDLRWVSIVLASNFGQRYLASVRSQQTGQANINGTKLADAPIPLPPIAEQRCIIEKVDGLMQICDELEFALGAAQDHLRRALEELLHRAMYAA